MAPQNTTVVFVPGAWHSPNCYDPVIPYLSAAGYKTSKVWTPSVLRNNAVPVSSLEEDVNEVRKHIEEAVDAGQKVVLVMHSYGGHPGSQAMEGFDQTTLANQGYQDGRGVVHAIYMAAFMVRLGESPGSATDGPAPWITIREDGTCVPHNPAHVFYNDFASQEEVDRWVADLNPFSLGVLPGKLAYEPWKKIPTTYLSCENDNALPIDLQRTFIKNAIEAGATDMRVINWRCGHTPFAVRPLEVSQIIKGVAGDMVTLPSESDKAPATVTMKELTEVAV